MRRLDSAALALLLVVVGCYKEPPQVATSERTPPVSHPLPPAAAPGQADPECAAPLVESPTDELTVGKRVATRKGSKLVFNDRSEDGTIRFGVLGPFNEDSAANLVALGKYLAFFTAEHADAVIVAGDSGETEDGIAHIFEALAQIKIPVFVVIGNRECRADYASAQQRVASKYSNLVDLDQYRVIQFPEATLVSLPGYHDPNFINCAKGCRYFQSTVDEVVEAAKAAASPVVVVSHGPPMGEGSQAVDYAAATGNVGDPSLQKAIIDASIPFGIFTHIKEAGGRATDLEGTTIIDPGHPVRALYLNPGPANTAKWKMNDGTFGHGFAAVLTIKGKEASWKSLRLPAPAATNAPSPTPSHPAPPRAPVK